jgi:DHA2 family multidrug resistance protein
MALTLVNASLPDVSAGIGASGDEGTWLSTSYIAVEAATIIVGNWVAATLSFRRSYITAMFLFVAACVASAFNRLFWLAIVLRAFQGLGGGAMVLLAFASIFRFLPKTSRPEGLAALALSGTLPSLLAPWLSGRITVELGWPVLFVAALPLTGVAFVLLNKGLPSQEVDLKRLREFDWESSLYGTLGIASLEIALDQGNRLNWFDSGVITGLLLVGIAGLALFVIREVTCSVPMVNLRLLKEPHFALACAMNLAFRVGLLGIAILLPQYLVSIQGYRALEFGPVLMWAGLPQIGIVGVVLLLARRFDMRILIACGLLLFATSCLLSVHHSALEISADFIWALALQAVAQPLFILPTYINGSSRVTPEFGISAGALFNASRSLGQALGTAWVTTLLTHREKLHSARLMERLAAGSETVVAHVDGLASQLGAFTVDAAQGQRQALSVVMTAVRRQAMALAFNDLWLSMGLVLLGAAGLVFLLPPFDPANVGWPPIRRLRDALSGCVM